MADAGTPAAPAPTPDARGGQALAQDVGVLHQQLEAMQSVLGAGLVRLDFATGRARLDARAAQLHGLPAEPAELTIDALRAFVVPEDRAAVLADTERAWQRRQTTETSMRVRRADGALRHLLNKRYCEYDAQGRPTHMLCVLIDTTEAYEQEQATRERAEWMEFALEAGHVGLWQWDLETGRTSWDATTRELLGLAPGETESEDLFWALVHPDDRAAAQAKERQALANGAPTVETMLRVTRHDGRVLHMVNRARIERAADGRPLRMLGINLDITEQVLAREALSEAQERMHLAAAATGIGAWEFDCLSGQTVWDARTRAIYDIGPDAPVSRDVWISHIHPDDRATLLEAQNLALADSSDRFDKTFRIVTRAGAVRHVAERGVIVRAPDGTPRRIIGTVLDITHEHVAEQAAREAAERLRLAAEAAGLGSWEVDLATRHMIWDAQTYRLFGYRTPPAAAPYDIWLGAMHPDDRAKLLDLSRVAGGAQAAFADEYRIFWPDGSLRMLAARGVVHAGEPGQGAGRLIGVLSDVTEQRDAEAARREKEAAERASRAKTEFLSRMSHELRTPLNAILGFAQLIRLDSTRNAAAANRERLLRIESAGQHLLQLINEVLDLARIEAGKLNLSLEPVHVAGMLQEAIEIVRPQADAQGIVIDTGVSADLYARADRVRLHQVLLNLLSNAVKYNRPRGRVQVLATRDDAGALHLAVRDTGPGMSPEQLARLFEPFNRLGRDTASIEGTGLGLPISRQLVEQMGGRIAVESRVGIGSEFSVVLPLARTPAEPVRALAPAGARSRDDVAGSLLYIEDNPSNTQLVEQYVGLRARTRLWTAPDGASGIALARVLQPDLILLDMRLPDLDGFGVFARLRALMAGGELAPVPCVALSANAMPDEIAHAKAVGFADYWTKPIELARFLDGIDRLLSGAD